MVPYVDTFYVDLKAVTPSLHKKYCGVDNRIILHNIKFLDRQKGGFQMILRTPLIPGVNDSEEELHKIGTFCQNLDRLVYLQLLPYHALGSVTYKETGPRLHDEIRQDPDAGYDGSLPQDSSYLQYYRTMIET